MRLDGKVALITGAAAGIGHAVCALFAHEGAIVFAGDSASLRAPQGAGIHALTFDVTREEDWQRAVDTVIEKCGRLDVLVNVALACAVEPLHELEAGAWAHSIALNQTAVFLGMREALGVTTPASSGTGATGIAYGCLFLASDEASHVSGVDLIIDGTVSDA